MSGPWRVHADEPVLLSPELTELAELARNQRVPPLRTTAAMVSAKVDAHGRSRARTWIAVGAIAAVAAAMLVTIGPRVLEPAGDATPSTAVHDDATTPPGGEVEPAPASDAVVPAPEEPMPPSDVTPTIEAQVPPVETPLQQPKPGADAPMSAAELARAAERSMAAGRRDETIRLLGQLVRRYPKSSPARAALFDLGRLLRASGRTDEARCAYQLLRQRWPNDAMRGEIDRVLKSLGEGPACRGLQVLQ
jgi:tetratricopeptide (TPR) repeat protein